MSRAATRSVDLMASMMDKNFKPGPPRGETRHDNKPNSIGGNPSPPSASESPVTEGSNSASQAVNNVADGGGDGRTRRPSSDPGRHGPQPSHGPVKPPEPNLNGSGPTAGSGASGQNLQCHVSDKSSHRVYWRPPFMMAFGLILGTLISLAGHHVFYSSLAGRVVALASDQEFNVRVGSFFALATQLALSSSVWVAYEQWLWRTMKVRSIALSALDSAFGAVESVWALFDPQMIRRMKGATLLAILAWCLQIPALLTPATLFVAPSNVTEPVDKAEVWRLNIARPRDSHLFAYSTPFTLRPELPSSGRGGDDDDGGTGAGEVDEFVRFAGPRSVLSRLASATSSLGEILPLTPPFQRSEYDIVFMGPHVKCSPSNDTVVALTNATLAQRMNTLVDGYRQIENAYLAFMPSRDVLADDGEAEVVTLPGGTAFSVFLESRNQRPGNASNEVWLTYRQTYKDENGFPVLMPDGTPRSERLFRTCILVNATYDVHMKFDLSGVQHITTNKITTHGPVEFPVDRPDRPSNLSQHAYSAVFWVLADQLVGEMGFWNNSVSAESPPSTQNDTSVAKTPAFSSIDTRIEHNSLLGSDDLDYFFLTNKRLYNVSLLVPLSPQRLLDKALARNHTLDALVEDLAFNITVPLMNNHLLCERVTLTGGAVRVTTSPNKYVYSARNLLLSYLLAIAVTLAANVAGAYAFLHNRAAHNRALSTILSVACSRNLSMLFPSCCRGALPLPEATLAATLQVTSNGTNDMAQSSADSGAAGPMLRIISGSPVMCEACKQEAKRRCSGAGVTADDENRRRGSATGAGSRRLSSTGGDNNV